MEEGVGTLSITGVTPLPSPIEISLEISRLYATFGTTNTRIGYEGGGVYRNDYGRAAWVTPPSLSLKKIGNDIYVNLVVPKMQGSFAVGSSEGIPVDTLLINPSSPPPGPEYQMITITYEAYDDDPWDALLWSAFFNEINEMKIRDNVEGVSIEVNMLTSTSYSLEITKLTAPNLYFTMTEPEYRVDVRGS